MSEQENLQEQLTVAQTELKNSNATNDRLHSDLQVAQQNIQKLNMEVARLQAEAKVDKNRLTAVRNLTDQLKEQYLGEATQVFNLQDAIQLLNSSFNDERTAHTAELTALDKKFKQVTTQADITKGQLLKMTAKVGQTEELTYKIFNIMFSLTDRPKVCKKVVEFIEGKISLKDIMSSILECITTELKFDSPELQELTKHCDRFSSQDATEEENEERLRKSKALYQAVWLLAKAL